MFHKWSDLWVITADYRVCVCVRYLVPQGVHHHLVLPRSALDLLSQFGRRLKTQNTRQLAISEVLLLQLNTVGSKLKWANG